MSFQLRIDLFSDVVCPWCYIGAVRLDAAREALAHPADGAEAVMLDVTLHAFQLDPEADPHRSEPVIDAYARKFGGEAEARRIIAQVTDTAAAAGLEFDMDRAIRANTLGAHRLVWWSTQPDNPLTPWATHERLMKAYFSEGRNIADTATLGDIASELGADADAATAMLNSEAGMAEVERDLASAAELGVTAVPTFIVNQQWAIPGAQDPETLVRVLRRVAETGA